MADTTEEDDDFNRIIRPTLVKQLQGILEQYPDDGQILKELIQNADDAGAREVHFVLDTNSHQMETLITPEMAPLQGPSLMVFNNARITPEDWRGIRTFGDSIKKDDPARVGRFGLGFKSVFHMTDVPQIMSGEHLAFLDPQEKFLPDKLECYRTTLTKLSEFEHQLTPFRLLRDHFSSDQSAFEGTLFRFPLRTNDARSEISRKSFKCEAIKQLLDTLQKDGHMILQFLRHVEQIKVFETTSGGRKKIFSVSLNEHTLERTRKGRSHFREQIKLSQWSDEEQHVSYPIGIITEGERGRQESRWIITEYLCGGEDLQTVKELHKTDTKNVPWVAVAAPTFSDPTGCHGVQDYGHVFCFLPLPLPTHGQSMTNLPIHVNAYFSVEQNRRHLKWSSGEEKAGDQVRWNEALVGEVLPRAYAMLIRYLLKDLQNMKPSLDLDVKHLHNLLPDLSKVDRKWLSLGEGVYGELRRERLFQSSTGDWVTWPDALFHSEDLSYDTAVICEVLEKAQYKVVTSPMHVKNPIMRKNGNETSVSPSLVREALREIQAEMNMTLPVQEKLLMFLLEGGTVEAKDVEGLALIPGSDGSSLKFGIKNKIYLPSEEHPREILPGFKSLIHPELDSDIMTCLRQLARKGFTPLENLSVDGVLDSLPSVMHTLTNDAKKRILPWRADNDKYFTKSWLVNLWKYLRKNLPHNLSKIEGLYLLPLDSSRLAALKQNSPLLQKGAVSECIQELLINCGITIWEKPDWFPLHDDLTRFVVPASPDTVTQALIHLEKEIGTQLYTKLGNQTAQAKKELANLLGSVTCWQESFMKRLPILQLQDDAFTDCTEATYGFSGELPFRCKEPIIKITDQTKRFAERNGVVVIGREELILDHIITTMRCTNFYTEDEKQTFLFNLLTHEKRIWQNNDEAIGHLTNMPFVRSDTGGLVKPGGLYDPADPILNELLSEEGMFPTQKWRGAATLKALRELGLKGRNQMEQSTFINVAQKVASLGDRRKATLLMDLMKENAFSIHCIMDIACVPIIDDKPRDYPKSLKWKGVGVTLAMPSEITSMMHMKAVGSQMFCVSNETETKLGSPEKWTEELDLEFVIGHLQQITSCYRSNEKTAFMTCLQATYSAMNEHHYHTVKQELAREGLAEWLWSGTTFEAPEKIWLEPESINLAPHFYFLSEELEGFRHLFAACGARKKCDWNVVLRSISDTNRISSEEQARDLRIVLNILNQFDEDYWTTDESGNTLLPIQTSEDRLELEPKRDCFHCDRLWLLEASMEKDAYPVHPDVPIYIKSSLRKIEARLMESEILIDTNYTQREPLTTRLKNLLQQYKDGFAVPKEIIQNADDAGATEVKLLYDERKNSSATTKLYNAAMAEFQGPALWAFNNAQFTEADFMNLSKLSGATKEGQLDKIGRFGLGFCSVYNLTDVPSFVSGRYYAVLDPHSKHLGKSESGIQTPGLRMNLAQAKVFKDQFAPFQGVFDFDMNSAEYQYTLFRFPLRTSAQAERSEISKLHYNQQEVHELLSRLEAGADYLLQFTQNVNSVSVYHIPEDATSTAEVRLLYSITKTIQEGDDTGKVLALAKTNIENDTSPKTSLSCLMEIKVHHSGLEGSFFNGKRQSHCRTWAVTSSVGTGRSLQLAKGNKKDLPVGGIAFPFLEDGKMVPGRLEMAEKCRGGVNTAKVFCFLPLPIETNLPVHINGYFRVAMDRRSLAQKNMDDKHDEGALWNEALQEDALTKAYTDSLIWLIKKCSNTDLKQYPYHHLWPSMESNDEFLQPLCRAFFKSLVESNHQIFFDEEGKVFCLKQARFMDSSLQSSHIRKLCMKAYRQVAPELDGIMIEMPANTRACFVKYGLGGIIDGRTLSLHDFFREYFFRNVEKFLKAEADEIIKYALLMNDPAVNEMLKTFACIPVRPNGARRKITDLIHPEGKAAFLFTDEDQRFPEGAENLPSSGNLTSYDLGFRDRKIIQRLLKLGMCEDDLPWDLFIELAESAAVQGAEEKARNLLKYLSGRIDTYGFSMSECEGTRNRLGEIAFLPIMPKPKGFLCAWKGENWILNGKLLGKASELSSPSHYLLVGSLNPIADLTHDWRSRKDQQLLKFLNIDHKPTVEEVAAQLLEYVLLIRCETLSAGQFKGLEEMVHGIYRYLSDCCHSNGEDNAHLQKLKERPCLLVDNSWKFGHQCATSCMDSFGEHLVRLPPRIQREFKPLADFLGVRKHFGVQDFVGVLQKVQEQYVSQPLSEGDLDLCVKILKELADIRTDDDLTEVPVPDRNRILKPATTLCYTIDDVTPSFAELDYTHTKISPHIAERLHIVKENVKIVDENSLGIPFGQKEELLTRINRLLVGYPRDESILKEMLQNADDSGASEIHFVLDETHYGSERLMEGYSSNLQGPALLVYNNRPFTEEDLKGIQKLGEGSKGSDPTKTGQYGVGFNCVYHLTDTPTFMSTTQECGLILCTFDPHCKYIPSASKHNPGRMFTGLKKLQAAFPDVFAPYEGFDVDQGTLFRFPLRTEKMAEQGSLSASAIDSGRVAELCELFIKEAPSFLLFLQNIRRIKISRRTLYDGTIVIGEVSCKVETEGGFDVVSAMKRDGLDTPHCESISQITVTTPQGKQEWLVSNCYGIKDPSAIPDDVRHSWAAGDLKLLPRGGIAVQVDRKVTKDKSRKHKMYCFLPLPCTTDLAVHINGHFALEHESRRSLWSPQGSNFRTLWNRLLMEQVLAPAYLNIMERCNLSVKTLSDLKWYNSIFPPIKKEKENYLGWLSVAFYKGLAQESRNLLPIMRQDGRIEWYPPCGGGSQQVFFNSLQTQIPVLPTAPHSTHTRETEEPVHIVVEKLLIRCDFNLVASPMKLKENFTNAGVKDIPEVSPSSVLTHLRNHELFRGLPKPVEDTKFGKKTTFLSVLKYVTKGPGKNSQMQETPFLYAQDGQLYNFETTPTKFLSRHVDVLRSMPSLLTNTSALATYKRTTLEEDRPLFRDLTICEFVKLLPEEIDAAVYMQNAYVSWTPKQRTMSEQWVRQVWEFIAEQVRDALVEHRNHNKTDTMYGSTIRRGEFETRSEEGDDIIRLCLEPLKTCSILPTKLEDLSVIQPKVRYQLVSVGRAIEVLDLAKITKVELAKALKKMQIASPYYCPYGESLGNLLINRLISSLDKPDRLLICLTDGKVTWNLSSEEAKYLREYLAENLDQLKTVPNAIVRMRSLKIYETTSGRIIGTLQQDGDKASQHSIIYVIPVDIPTIEMDTLQSTINTFLYFKNSMAKLYDFLGYSNMEIGEWYGQFVLTDFIFRELTGHAQLIHLKFLHQKIDRQKSDITMWENCISSKYDSDQRKREAREKMYKTQSERNALLDRLKSLSFLRESQGNLFQRANYFFDPRNPVFHLMEKEKRPPTVENILKRPLAEESSHKIFDEDNWLDFLATIGLNSRVTGDMLVAYMKQVALLAKVKPDEHAHIRAQTLLSELFKDNTCWQHPRLAEIANIEFLPTKHVNGSLKKLYAQHSQMADGTIPFTCFRGNLMSNGHDSLVWSVAFILDDCSHLKHAYVTHNQRTQMTRHLGSLEQPSVDLVIQNARKVFTHWRDRLQQGRKIDSKLLAKLKEVAEQTFGFLDAKTISDNDRKQVQKIPFVWIEENKDLVSVEGIAISHKEKEIPPYLYSMPMEIGKYHQFFKTLGAKDHFTVLQYAGVLKKIHIKSGGLKLDPNELKCAMKAMKYLLELIATGEDSLDRVDELYWLNTEKQLASVKDMVCMDDPSLQERIRDSNVMIPLKDIGYNDMKARDAFRKFPECIRPKMASALVHEELCSRETDSALVGIGQELAEQLMHTQVREGIIRVANHGLKREKNLNPDEEETIDDFLAGIKFVSLPVIRTRLVYQGEVLPGSETTRKSFFVETRTGNAAYIVYALQNTDNRQVHDFRSELASLIENKIDGLLDSKVEFKSGVIGLILHMRPEDIHPTLTEKGIEAHISKCKILPDLGSFIPLDMHHLLMNDFEFFKVDEYVGYEIADETCSGGEKGERDPSFMYAKIMNECEHRATFTTMYKIDLGVLGSREVSALDLYKFVRPQPSGPVVTFDFPIPREEENFDEIKKEILDIMKECKSLTKEDRKKVIKRLILKWHPDKNPHRTKLATEVFQFIQKQLEHLDTLPDTRQDFSSHYNFDTYGAFFDYMNRRGREHRQHRDRYNENFRRSQYNNKGYNCFVPPTFSKRSSNFLRAKQWLMQARFNFEATKQERSAEWQAYKCHKTAETALTAACYSIKNPDRTSGNLTIICSALSACNIMDKVSRLEQILGNPEKMLNPDMHIPPLVPNTAYEAVDLASALKLTEEIIVECDTYIAQKQREID